MYQRPSTNLHNCNRVDLFTLWVCQIYNALLFTGDMLGGIKTDKAYHQEEALRNARQVSNKRGNNSPAFPHKNTSASDVIFLSGSTMITLPFPLRQKFTTKLAGDTCAEIPTIIPWAYDKYNASTHKLFKLSLLIIERLGIFNGDAVIHNNSTIQISNTVSSTKVTMSQRF